MTDYVAIKAMITATLDRLNAHGVVASVSDATIALHKARDAKVAEAFRAIFGDMTLEKLATASAVLDEMFPRPKLTVPVEMPAPSVTAPPAQPPVTVTKPKRKTKG